ncbi:MAG: aspartyl protease family protein [Verrucomicrobiota bacterium]|nr:retropepsin-like domain-containing protein [Chthoniobacterales bacterium]MBA3762931.1 retropepsin-like domain-containing protein [Chthoniobacterales bacterium]MDQ3314685.1 aspartyl protease family protein [Verrucomicrobiota bacterium]
MITRNGLGSLHSLAATLLVWALASSGQAAPLHRAATPRVPQAPAAEQKSLRAGRVPQFQALPLERSGQNHLLVRAFINDKPALLGVDTGAPVSAIALTRVAHFGMTPAPANSEIPTRVRINGSFAGVVMAQGLRLGALNLIDEPMVAVDLGSSSKAAKMMNEQPIDGLLGADILFPTAAVLDCRAQILILKVDPNARGTAPGVSYAGFSRVPIHVSAGYNLYVDGALNGKPAKLMIDTGAYGTLLNQRFVRSMRIPLRDTPFRSAGVNLKQRGVQLATISKFAVGLVNMRSKEVGVIDLAGLVHGGMLDASPPVAGLLGSEILQRHSAIIDFGSRTLYLKR